MRKLILLCYLCIALTDVWAQDPHFSQFFSSPLTLNPAFTGKFYGTYRVSGNHRNQWPEIEKAYITTTASVDFQMLQNKIAHNDTWGMGIMGYADKSANGTVTFNYGSLSTAYHKGLDEEGFHQLGVGFQLTQANMFINTAQLTFADQLTSLGYTGISSETFYSATLKGNYLGMNAGVLYNGSTNDRNNFYTGASIYHINRPKQNFTAVQYVLPARITVHAGGYFPLGYNSTIHVSGLHMMQGGGAQTIIGGALQLTVNPNTEKPSSLYVGSWLRLNDALIPYIGLEFDDFRFGITYDYNYSSLKTGSQNRGGMEISLVYTRRPSTERPVNCPKF